MLASVPRSVILITWKDSGNQVAYSSLRGFVADHSEYSEHTINNYISRQKIPFEDDKMKLEKVELKTRK